jgi:hypothetical protein
VTVHLKTGQSHVSDTTPAKGDPTTPLSADEFVAKFRLLSNGSLGTERSRAIEVAVASLGQAADCEQLLDLLLTPV